MICFFKRDEKNQNYIKTKKNNAILKCVQYWVHTCNNKKCKIRISINLLGKLTCCSKTVLFSTKLDHFVQNLY